MRKSNRTVAKFLLSGLLILEVLLVGSCDSWMSNDDFMSDIESEVHDANAAPINVYVRYANNKMGTTEPQGSTTMKVDVASKLTAVTNDDYGFVRWAAFSTNDFSPEKQHSKLTFITEENYNENYKSKELPESVVQFSEPTNPVTEVKIFQARDDIFIIPIVASRPAYVQSVPGAGDSSIVKNTSIRILFSKPIDESTILDEEGNLNFSITSSAAVFTDDDSEIEANDITDFFEYKFSDSKKMLTLKLKGDKLLDNRQYITVTLLEGLKDTYGYQMNGNYTFKFTTGTSTDSLAPMIEVIYGGTDDICNLFVTFGEDGQMKGTATNEAKNAPSDIASDKYTEQVVAQRIYDKLNIFVKANDIINSGNADINPAKDLSEDNVALIYIAAGLYINADGSPADFKNTSIAKKNYNYISGTIDPNSQIKQQFTDVVPLDKDGNKYNGGTIYTYDVSSLPDGLIRIDVWAGDMTGNAGGPDDKGAPYIEKHDNGYKSIFVVKDTTPIDSAEVKAQKKVISNSASAPYYWYNLNTLNTMELFDSPENKIQDAGHPKLRALDKNLWWTFKVGNVTESISKDDSTWKRIHDETDGTTSLHYNLANATAPSVDGPVDITLYLKDDMGNMSAPVLLDSIMYDNTAPSVKLKAAYGDFVNEDGSFAQHNSKPALIEQILKVNFTETNENNAGSGIRRIEIHVKKDNQEVAVPLDSEKFKVKWSTDENAIPSSAQEIAIAADDSATTDKIKVFKVDDSSKITTGTLFIYGLTLGENDGKYTVCVDLFDSALNKTPETAITLISRDTTPPEINKVKVVGAKVRTIYGETEKTWWIPKEMYEAGVPNKVSFQVLANEAGSGLKTIKLSKDIEFTSESKIKKSEEYLVAGTDYSLDTENNIITLLDHYNTILINAPEINQFEITLENVKLKNINNAAGNKPAFIVEDFVDNEKSNIVEGTSGENEQYLVYYPDETTGTLIFADSTPPQIAELKIKDAAQNNLTNPDAQGRNENNYTDSQNVTLILNLVAEDVHSGSGVETIHLSENAIFTSATKIKVDGIQLPENEYTFAADNKSVTFAKVFVAANEIEFSDVYIVSSDQGNQIVKADLTDLVGLDTVASTSSNTIILDTVSPVIGENGINWDAAGDPLVSIGNVQSEVVSDQSLKVDFVEETAGVKVIRFDVSYEDGASYETPFGYSDFKLTYNNDPVSYEISGPYILLRDNKNSGTFNFNNLKLAETALEGQYNIKITLLDAAENKNPQPDDNTKVYKKEVFMDRTAPVVNKVKIEAVKSRTVYQDNTHTKTWWMPHDKFDENGNLSKVDFVVNFSEVGTGLKFIELSKDVASKDVEFTDDTRIKVGNDYLIQGVDYTLDTANRKITLLNHSNPKLKGTTTEFTLENIKLNKINTNNGNQTVLAITDFVGWEGSNRNNATGSYDIYYNDVSKGEIIFADSTRPEITGLKIEDSAHKSATNPDTLAYDKTHYTDNNNIILTLTLKAESDSDGSGVQKITLTDNAVFTSSTVIKVDGILLPSTGYSYTSDYKSVIFNDVFTAANTLEFSNVQILSTQQGNQTVKADLTDFVGLTTEVSAETNVLRLDTVNPRVDSITWETDDTSVTKGSEKDVKIDTQTLKIDFTEETAGIKVIKFDIHLTGNTSSFDAPFNENDFALKYNGTELVKNTDYVLDTNNRYIILTEPKTSGSFTFENLKLNGTEQAGTYNVDVIMLDAAENKVSDTKVIDIDSTPPVITGELEIPDLIKAYQFTTNGISTTEEYWLPMSYVNGSAKSPDSIPLYITINENGSGIKVITFAENVTLNKSLTKLYMVSSDGTETPIEDSKYDVTPENRTITINQASDALNKNQTNLGFKILVKTVGFNTVDTDETSANKVSVKVSDVAMNPSTSVTKVQGVPDGQKINSDSYSPVIKPDTFKLLDRGTLTDTVVSITASENYTNDSVVNMEFELNDSEAHGSGYHKFVITNASFTANTTVTAGTMSGIPYVLSEDNKTLTLKTTDAKNLVIRDAVKVTITNVQLDNVTSGENKSVTLKVRDLVNRESSVVTDSIYYDNEPPQLEKLFAANYTKYDYYKPSINVYPHANEEAASGVSVSYGTKIVPTFYTATTYNSGYYTVKGEVSSSSSSLTRPTTYGAVLGFRATDNVCLGGYVRTKTFLYYKADANFTLTKAEILTGTNNTFDINSDRAVTSDKCSATSEALWFGISTGKYSAVIVDEAGNVSDIFHFAVVKDTSRPVTTDFANREIIESPDASYSIYRNATADTTSYNSSSYNYGSYNSSSITREDIRTVKFVTKKADKKFKLYLKLGGTSTTDHIYINGNTVSTSSLSYDELEAKQNNSPIEQYAISTWYGAWPTSTSTTTAYEPAVPRDTTFPGGGSTIANASSGGTTAAYLVRDYFGYTSASTSATWRVQSGYNKWWPFTKKTTNPTSDTEKNSDSGNKIYSYVDASGNLVIEVPNQQSTPPITVFLRDGCGNMSYVVLGLNGNVAASFDFDDKLGTQSTSYGVVVTPQIVQNPHLTYTEDTDGDILSWNSKNYYWNSQSGNATEDGHDGVGETFGFMKDKTKNATYYNTALYVDANNRIQKITGTAENYKKAKLALTLQYSGSPESVRFETETKTAITSPDSNAPAGSVNDYTCRALLYCTTDSAVPDYQNIVKDEVQIAGSVTHAATSYRTNWVGVKAPNNEDQATIIFDYPEPDYTTLGWTVNNATTHEPQPYYIWYIFEDRVGNYEIGKVVNNKVSGSSLKTESRSGFDMWLYDGEAPVVTLAETGANPSTLDSTTENVKALISDNNGYVPYYAGSNIVWIRSNPSQSSNGSTLIKKPAGTTWGVTNKVENEGNGTLVSERQYLPFAKLTVSKEITGIKAFCWSTSSTAPAYDSCGSTDNSQGDAEATGKWYAGSGTDINGTDRIPATQYDVGWTYTYKNPTNAYFPYGTGNTYAGKYTGTKINEVLPYLLINNNPGTDLYLYVMDWTGNVAMYKMGSSLKFKNDTAPVTSSITTNYAGKICNVDGEYYVHSDGSNINVRIAGTREKAKAEEPITIKIPNAFFSDSDSGSGYKGFTLNSNDVEHANGGASATNAYLEIPFATYKEWSKNNTPTDVTAYFYDNVGNQLSKTLKCYFDITPPTFNSISFVTKEDSATKFIHEDTTTDPINGVDGFGDVTNYHVRTATKHTDISHFADGEVQELWVNKSVTSKFHVNFKSESVAGDFDKVVINRWNDATKWTEIKSSTSSGYALGTDSTDGYDYLSTTNQPYAEDGTYFQIDAKDKAGNHSYQYFKIHLDKKGPELTTRTGATDKNPTIELQKGSINEVTKNQKTTYYYTAEAGKELKVNFAVTDAGIKNSLQTFKYSFVDSNNESDWTTFNGADGKTDITALVTGVDVEKIYLKDVLGNKSTLTPGKTQTADFAGYKYKTKTMTKLTYYAGTPAKPTLTINNYNSVTSIKTSKLIDNNIEPTDSNYAKKSTDTLDTGVDYKVILTDKELKRMKISFNKPDKIIGYLVTDESGKEIRTTKYKTERRNGENVYILNLNTDNTVISEKPDYTTSGYYDFNSTLSNSFIENLPLLLDGSILNPSKTTTIRKYYAVDVVGNISESLTVQYTYSDLNHQASDIKLITSTTGITASDAKDDIEYDIENGTITLANIAYSALTTDPDGKRHGTRFFNDGWLLLECTLKNKADIDYDKDTHNTDTPNKVFLNDVWGGDWAGSADRGSASVSDNNMKVYPSDNKNSNGRYYCYIALKVSNFENNDAYGGSQLYAQLVATTDNSTYTSENFLLNGDMKDVDIRWRRDVGAPEIAANYLSYDNRTATNRLHGYTPSSTISIVQDKENAGWTGKTNYYSSGLYIYIPKSGIKDGFIYNGDAGDVLNKGDFAAYSGLAKYETIVTGGTSDIESGWQDVESETISLDGTDTDCYKIKLPNVKTTHSEIKLKIKDAVGNEGTQTIKIGKNDDAGSLWWIVDDIFTSDASKTEITPPTVTNWDNPPSSYEFAVNPPVGSIIKSVTAKVDGVVTDATVTFNDYANQPTLDGSQGWLNLSGLKVTLAITQIWQPQSVEITVTGVNSDNDVVVTKTFENFIRAKVLQPGDIFINAGETPVIGESKSRDTTSYDLPIRFEHDAGVGNITKIESSGVDGVTVSWTTDVNEANPVVTITGVPGIDWEAKNVTLTVNDTITLENVFTIRAINADDITFEPTTTWDGDTAGDDGSKTITFDCTLPASASDIPALGVSYGKLAGGIENTINVKFFKDWEPKDIDVKFSDTVTKSKVFTVPAISADDIRIKIGDNDPRFTSSGDYELKIEIDGLNEKDGTKAIGPVIDSTKLSVEGATQDATTPWDAVNSVYKINVQQGWSGKTVNIVYKVNDEKTITKNVFNVPALVLSDVTIDGKEWTEQTDPYEFTIGLPDGATMENVFGVELDSSCSSSAKLSWTPGESTFTIGMPEGKTAWEEVKIWDDQPIKVLVKNTVDTTLAAKTVLTIPCKALTAEDIEIIGDADTSGENPTVAITLKGDASHLALLRAGVSAKCGETDITATLSESDDVVTLSNIPAATWTAQTITLTVGSGLMSKEVMTVAAKQLTADDIILSGNTWSENGGITITIKIPKEVTITSVESGSDNVTLTWANNTWTESGYSVTNVSPTFTKGDTAAYAVIKVNNVPKNVFIVPGTDGSTTVGASNNNQRSIFGFRTKGNSYSATSTSAGATSEAPKTRSVSLTSWVNDLFNNDSEAAVETVKDEVKSSSKKSAKKSKKSAKAAKVEKVAAEALAETSAAPVNELAETVAATVSAVTEVVEDTAPAVDEVSASLEAEAAAPLSAEPELPDASVESPSASAATIILAIAALCAAAAALTIIALKKRAAKK